AQHDALPICAKITNFPSSKICRYLSPYMLLPGCIVGDTRAVTHHEAYNRDTRNMGGGTANSTLYVNFSVTIKALILEGEGERLDFKNRISNCGKIAKTLVAFANSKGGRLLIGVADDGTIKGVKNEEEEKYMLQQAGQYYCRPVITPYIEEVYVDHKLVLVADIGESDSKPHYALDEHKKWWVYIRVEDKSLLAGKVMVDVLHRKNSMNGALINYTDNEKELLRYLHIHKQMQLPELCKHLKLPKRQVQRILVNLIVAGVIEIYYSG